MKQLTIDVGGTFTDCLVLDDAGRLHRFKASTTPSDPTRGVLDSIAKAAAAFGQAPADFLATVERIVHGTTLGTNALITRRGVQVGMITTAGFRDVIEIRRGIKNLHGSLFEQFVPPYEPLIPRYLRLGVDERVRNNGEVVTPLDEEQVRQAARDLVAQGCEAIAVCFLYSYLNPAHEQQAKAIVREVAPKVYVTTSHEILPVWREFERFSTTVVSAYIGPIIASYLEKLEKELRARSFSGALLMMQANALVQTIEHCIDRAVYLLDSGPAAAPSGSKFLGQQHGHANVLSVDMGGTSFDICMIKNGAIPTTQMNWVGEDRVAIKMVDLVTIGAGGGSIASIDSLGLLQVGPRSAGADPGPAAYGKGDEATVTDANLVLGYVPADYFLGGEMQLDLEGARKAIERVGGGLGMDAAQTAMAIYNTINTTMANAITEMFTKKGHDPRGFVLVAGGGAGGAHVAAIAKRLGLDKVIIPRVAALLSAYGMYNMDLGLEFARSRVIHQKKLVAEDLNALFEEMGGEAIAAFAQLGVEQGKLQYVRTVELRYAGQWTDVEVELPEGILTQESIEKVTQGFHEKFKQLYMYNMPWLGIEFLTFRLRASAPRPHLEIAALERTTSLEAARKGARPVVFEDGVKDTPLIDWDELSEGHSIAGPAIIVDRTTSVLVPYVFSCVVDAYGSLVLNALREPRKKRAAAVAQIAN